MAFDLSTAKPVSSEAPSGFDLSTAKPESADPFAWQSEEQRAEAERMLASPDRGGFLNFLTGADRTMETVPRISEDDVFGLTGGLKDNIDAVVGTSLTFDPEARKNIYSAQMQDAGIEHRWVKDQFDNNVLIWKDRETGEERQGVLDPQGFNIIDLSATLGAVGVGKVADLLKRGGAAILGRGAAQPTVKGALAGGAVTGGAESVVMDTGANAAGADIPPDQMITNAALSGLTGGAFDGIAGPGRAGIVKKVRDTSPTAAPKDAAQAKATMDALRQSGMGDLITGPQLSNDPYQLMVQRTLFSLPGSSRKLAERLQSQDQRGYDALMGFLSDLAPAQALDGADTQAKRFAESYLKSLRQQASDAAKPFYDAAYSVDLPPDAKQALLGDEVVASAFRKVTRTPAYAREVKQYGPDSLMPFDLVKRELDDQIAELKRAGRNNEARSVKAARDQMVEQLAEVSPDYRQALNTYAEAIGPFSQAEAGTIGKMARVSDEKAEQVVRHAFNNPDSAKIARKMVMEMDPSGETWNGLVRRFMSDRLGKMNGLLIDETGEMASSKGNVPKNLYDKIWPNQQAKEVMEASLSAEQRRRLEKIMISLNAYARGRGAGSETAMRGPLIDDLGRSRVQAAFQAITSPIKYFDDKFVENRVMRRSAALADAIMRTDDKALNAEMKKLMEVDPRTPEFMRGLEAVLGRVASGETTSQEQDR